MVNIEDLKRFYILSQQPHAFSTAAINKQPNGAKVMEFSDGDWKMVDTFYGGEPYGGCLGIEYHGRVVWTQVYYGQVHDTKLSVHEVYDFLRLALREPNPDRPFRGPVSFIRGHLEYCDVSSGDFATYSGKEVILEHGKEIYWGAYFGGLVDQRASSAD